MVFSSYTFLFLFLPVFLGTYFLTPLRFRNMTALVFSYLFYGWGAPRILPVLAISSYIDYKLSLFFSNPKHSRGHAQIAFWFGIAVNLGLLAYFKYSNFFIDEFNSLAALVGIQPFSWTAVMLPIGISFFTFQKISYLADVFTGKTKTARSFPDYALYVALFPQLIAGPIVRFRDISEQLVLRSVSADDFFAGMLRFCTGLGKKVLIADVVGAVADNVFALEYSALPIGYAWLGVCCYAFQIYFDFSGYSDMAIGLGRIMGFHFLENFNRPYISQNITEFWRRWHISLSNWMREYLYIPLGGNRINSARTYINLWIVFLLSGLWHGASWNFIAWGCFHGFFLSLDKLGWLRVSKRLWAPFNVFLTFLLVLVSWVLFRAESLQSAFTYLCAMGNLKTLDGGTARLLQAEIINNRAWVMLVVAAVLSFAPASDGLKSLVLRSKRIFGQNSILALQGAAAMVLLLLAVLYLSAVSFTPFLYFRF